MITIRRLFVSIAAAAASFAVCESPLGGQANGLSDWSEPVHLGPGPNSVHDEFGATVSRDGLSLYFRSARPGGFGGADIWVSRRASRGDPWGPAENPGPAINSDFNENTPRLSLDGHWLYFASDRPGGFGGSDVYVSRRRNSRDDFSWRAPENLGSGVNSAVNEGGPVPFEDDETGSITLYFFSPRPGGLGGADIYASTLLPDETFGPAVLVTELSSSGADIAPSIRRDGLEMFITSNRPGSMPFPAPFVGNSFDLWVSTRASTDQPWSVPLNLGPVVNTHFNDGWPALSFDGTVLYFSSRRPGAFGPDALDIYMSARSRLP
jgi:hypothetical protein